MGVGEHCADDYMSNGMLSRMSEVARLLEIDDVLIDIWLFV